jgi:hypothetical protein
VLKNKKEENKKERRVIISIIKNENCVLTPEQRQSHDGFSKIQCKANTQLS